MYTSHVLYKTIWNFIDRESIQSDNKWSCNSIFSLVNYFYLCKKSAIYCTRNWLGEESASLLGRWWIRDESRTLSRARPDRFHIDELLSFFAGRKKLEFLLENQGRLSSGEGGPLTGGGKNERTKERKKKKKKRKRKMYEWRERVVWWSRCGGGEQRTREIGTNFVASFCKAKGTYESEYINEAARFDSHRPRRVIFNY